MTRAVAGGRSGDQAVGPSSAAGCSDRL